MNDFVSVQDRDMRFLKVNKSIADFLGKKPTELIGKQCFKLIHNTQEPWPGCPHLKALESRKVVTEEIVDQQLGKTLLVTCSPFFDNNGEPIGSVRRPF